MTDILYMDNDCLSAFLWTSTEYILVNLHGGKIVIPEQVYTELSNPHTPHLKQKTDILIQNRQINKQEIMMGSAEYLLYMKLTTSPEKGLRVIGKGEAAAIVLAKQNAGTLASNNLRDINQYVKKYDLKHLTTADILLEAFQGGQISETNGNTIWAAMLQKNRKLPSATFTDYLSSL